MDDQLNRGEAMGRAGIDIAPGEVDLCTPHVVALYQACSAVVSSYGPMIAPGQVVYETFSLALQAVLAHADTEMEADDTIRCLATVLGQQMAFRLPKNTCHAHVAETLNDAANTMVEAFNHAISNAQTPAPVVPQS